MVKGVKKGKSSEEFQRYKNRADNETLSRFIVPILVFLLISFILTNAVVYPIDEIGSNRGTDSSDYEHETKEPEENEVKWYNNTFTWRYMDERWSVDVNIPPEKIEEYQSKNHTDVQPSDSYYWATTEDEIIVDLAIKLKSMAVENDLTDLQTKEFILKFVQYAIDYEPDPGMEYWKYPIETLAYHNGDCEDTTFLYATLMETMGYDSVVVFLRKDNESGHVVPAVKSEEEPNYTQSVIYGGENYYYAETTSIYAPIGYMGNMSLYTVSDIVNVGV